MRFENEHISLWYGTPDAPAPPATVSPGSEIPITIGVQPTDASNRVEVCYRVNQGSMMTVIASPLRNDTLRQIQYFRAQLPAFKAGDRVEYTAICRCAGRQVPSQSSKEQWNSFQVTEFDVQKTLVKSTARSTPLETSSPVMALNTQEMPKTVTNTAPSPVSTQDNTVDHDYTLNVEITTINDLPPTPFMEITGATIKIEGTASVEVAPPINPPPFPSNVSIKFGSSTTTQTATTQDKWRHWSLTVPVPLGNANADGQLLITAIAKFAPLQDVPTHAWVDVDNQPPMLTIHRPLPDETFALGEPVPLEVTATDNRQVAEVKWSLDNTNYNNAITLDPNGRGNINDITTAVQITDARKYTINVRAKDNFNNVAEQSVTIDVVPPFQPVDPADLTGQISYLGDLLDFAAKEIRVGPSVPLPPTERNLPSATDFSNIFCQRFSDLIDPQNHSVALQNVHQLRISVDVLRKYLLTRVLQWKNHPEALTASESDYRQQSYNALLRYLGTSDRELRRALTGDPAIRNALANRLGVGSEALQGLLLSSNQVTEESLERIFGLADTHFLRDPFAANATPPELLVKRRAHLRATWRQQDDTIRHPALKIPIPVIDPDLLQADDLNSSTAISLWQARQVQVQTLLKALRDLPGNNLAKFEAAVNLALKTGAIDQLKDLFAKYQSGYNIASQLQEIFLEISPFLYLMQVYDLLVANVSLVDDEWDQIYSILVQVQKLRDAYPTWRAQEIEKALALGPDDFKLLPATATPADLPLWRATQNAREAWKIRLAARIDQNQSVIQELKSVVDSAEAIALPLLRSHLIGLIKQAANQTDDVDTAEELTTELFIDFKSSNDQKISWVGQAIETLQGILFNLRMGRLAESPVVGANPAAGWQLGVSTTSFDEEWQWMGSYASWRSAMGVFLFPENFLQPAVRPLPPTPPGQFLPDSPGQTEIFKLLVESLRSSLRLTRIVAREKAKNYMDALKPQLPPNLPPNLPPAFIDLLNSLELQEPTSTEQIEVLHSKIDTVFMNISPNAAKFQDVANWVQEVFYFVPMLLAQQLERSGEYLAALDWYKAVYAYTLPTNRKVYKGLSLGEGDPIKFSKGDDWLLADFNPHKIAQTRANIYTRFTIRSLAQCLIAFADDQFTKETVETLPHARVLYLEALDLLNLQEMQTNPQLELGGGSINLENALLQSVHNHATMNLLKLRNGLNIAGLERPRRSETPIRTVTRRPTPYRYQVLIDRAKQLTATAGQIEASFLATLEKLGAEQYALLKAQQDIELSRTQVQLQNLRVTEAQDGVQLAELQRDRAQLQVGYYQDLLAQGLLTAEEEQLNALQDASDASLLGGLATLGIIGAGIATGGVALTGVGALGALGALGAIRTISDVFGKASSDNAQLQAARASFERREQDWNHQLSLSRQDVVIGNQQITLSQDHVAIAQQEFQIAVTQLQHTLETINFLANKFTNAELFDWMSRVLERVYAFFLQQATAIARLAEAQLAFERQEALPTFIQSDYWQAPDESTSTTQGPDRRGLTGSERLLQAITELDQYAFLNDRRKLQMSKTFSLAALSPFEFQRFRETGVMLFGTPMEFFDRDFPGHYLRLIRQVSTTVIALIPPTFGIHATLSNQGVSRVTINDGGFQDVEVHHGIQSVALTAPVNATGIFELNQQSEFLRPFEAIGVDTFWEFRLPKPANPFDFNTIADVLITVDYTALDSWDYRQQVIQQLDPNLNADRAFSFRNQFPDQWYDLHNPDQTNTPLTVKFKTLREDFPPNLDDLSIEQVVMYFVRSRDATYQSVEVNKLLFTADDGLDKVGGAATSINDIVSTRRGNASNWTPMIGKPPFGEWELSFPDNLQMRELFAKEQIEDILFVITYKGRTPEWPT